MECASPDCKNTFAPQSGRAKYCSTLCKDRHKMQLRRAQRITLGLCPQCDGPGTSDDQLMPTHLLAYQAGNPSGNPWPLGDWHTAVSGHNTDAPGRLDDTVPYPDIPLPEALEGVRTELIGRVVPKSSFLGGGTLMGRLRDAQAALDEQRAQSRRLLEQLSDQRRDIAERDRRLAAAYPDFRFSSGISRGFCAFSDSEPAFYAGFLSRHGDRSDVI